MRKVWLVAVMVLGAAVVAQAQVVAPTSASFTQSDADFAASASFTFEFFQCQSVQNGVGNNCATAPFQVGATVAKAAVTTLNPVDAFGNNRQFSLTGGVLPSAPLGVVFVGTVTAIGDPAVGVGNSSRSAASNPFYLGLRQLPAVTNPRVK